MRKKKESKPKSPKQAEIFAVKREWINNNLTKPNWPRDMKILGQMMTVVSNIEFWRTFKLWQKFENGLYWFLKDSGKAYLLEQYEKWKKREILGKLVANNEKTNYTLGDKVGEDIKVERGAKPKNLKDFLKE